jgi:hypothetical protein
VERKQLDIKGWDARLSDPFPALKDELKRLDSMVTKMGCQIRFALEAMSSALEVMEHRIRQMEKSK